MPYRSVSPQVNFSELEKQILDHWYKDGIVDRYLHKNDLSEKKFVFLDGPITANNPMAVHHGWGRTYKDLFQRYHNMKGEKQRFQNGFDCQGLWVEVEVEKELEFKNKKDIEVYGVDKFVKKCQDRVLKYSALQTEQSKRLGYFMDWERSYYTMSDSNNYAIWNFLQKVHRKGWLYKGHDAVPWCPRCETAISQHEILTEDYKELVHESVFIKLPLIDRSNTYLLVWTTTPWTIPANIAVAVDVKFEYSEVLFESNTYLLLKNAVSRVFANKPHQIIKSYLGSQLIGLKYQGPYDDLSAVKEVAVHPLFHTVIATDKLILPISEDEGTGLVHIAVSAGEEDFQLGKKIGLPLIPVIGDNADYLPNMGRLAGLNAKKHPEIIIDYLKSEKWILYTEQYKHRYPACWRCKVELVWRVADEWYIAMDKPDPDDPPKRSYRDQMLEIAKTIHWLPEFGLDRELDWLKNMHDWLISKKNRYWGLALPIYDCSCGTVTVIGSLEELKKHAVVGYDKFSGHSPHKPWIDEIQIKCPSCRQNLNRVADVGNPWLDAGIVAISTLPSDWFPADFISESFPGQFKNWFYSLIAMSVVMKGSAPFNTVLGYASLLAEDGRPMHKSWGNSIEFNEGADKIGVDVMRYLYVQQNPSENLLFGYKKTDEIRRRFHITLWNIYNFFITYANLDNFSSENYQFDKNTTILDRWLLIRLQETINIVTLNFDQFTPHRSIIALDSLVNDFSTWYIRRSRDRVGPTAVDENDKTITYRCIAYTLITITKLLAPICPFISEEIYTNLTGDISVHLADWPKLKDLDSPETNILQDMDFTRKIVELGLSARKSASIKVRQPLAGITIHSKSGLSSHYERLILEELNIKSISWSKSSELSVTLDTHLTPELQEEGQVRDLIRQVQEMRKNHQARLNQPIRLHCPLPHNPKLQAYLKSQTLSQFLIDAPSLSLELLP